MRPSCRPSHNYGSVLQGRILLQPVNLNEKNMRLTAQHTRCDVL